MFGSRVIAVLALASLGATRGCMHVGPSVPASVPSRTVIIDPGETDDCMRPTRRFGDGERVDPPLTDPELLAELGDVPLEVRRTARAVGLEGHIARLLRARRLAADDRSVEVVGARLQVALRISSVEIELGSLLFEADCTGDQMEAAIRELERREQRQRLALTISSVAAAAAVAVGGGLLDLRAASATSIGTLGIVGGLATAGLGAGALAPRRGRVVFPHERNLLLPIVRGEDPDALYPAYVFRMLGTPREEGKPTPREELLADWKRIVDDAIPERDRMVAREVLYGDGGVYDARLIDARERMYDALESQLNAFNRDLELLYSYFGRVLED